MLPDLAVDERCRTWCISGRMRARGGVFFVAAGVLLGGTVARAAEPPPPPSAESGAAPTLADFLAAAKKNNPQRRISRADVENARAARLEALAAILPTVSGQGNYTYNEFVTKFRNPFDPSGPDIVITPRDETDVTFSARAPIIDGPGLARWRAQRIAAEAAAADDEVSTQDLLLAVAQAYFDAVSAQEQVRAAERSKAVAEQNAKIVRTRVQAGTATALYANRADLEIARDEQARIAALRAFRLAQRSLATLTGLPEPAELPTADVEPKPLAPEASWQETADQKRAELAGATLRLQVARTAQKASWLQYAPTLAAHGADRYTNATGFTGKKWAWNVGLTLDWQLIDFGTRAGETRKARAEVMRTGAVLESTRAKVRDEVHSAWLDLDTAQAQLEAARRAADVAKQAADEMHTRFAAGTATQLDLIQTDRDQLTAEVDRIRAESDLAKARLKLRRAVGEEITGEESQ